MKKSTVTIGKLHMHLNKIVSIQGWVTGLRDLGSLVFWSIRDGSGFTQVVISRDVFDENSFKIFKLIDREAFVEIRGMVHENDTNYEISAQHIDIINSYSVTEEQLKARHLAIRNKRLWASLKIREEVIFAIHDFFRNKEYHLVNPPIIIPAVTGKKTGFKFEHFCQKAMLTESAALYMGALAASFGRVYSLHPVFRAEKSKTKRHLSEFWMLEVEATFVNFHQLMCLVEDLICYIINRVLQTSKQELAYLNRNLELLKNINKPFEILEYDSVIENLNSRGFCIDVGKGLGKHEKIISKDKKNPVFIINYPKKIGSWTAKSCSEDRTLSLNLILPEGYGEVIEGCERETDHKVYDYKFRAAGITTLDWYIDINKYGNTKRSGFGMGLERLCMWICGIDNIKDTIAFPRTKENFYP